MSAGRWLGAAGLACLLFLFRLDGVGLLSADEPRYASVGRAMATTGDWVTPRLWGQPWFEKPALLYWIIGASYRLGLGDDLAPRLGVALLSLAFLALYYWLLRDEGGGVVAAYSTAILATSAGWLVYSQIGVTDAPLAVCFSVALFLGWRWLRTGATVLVLAAGAMLGAAVLAKGLVPLVLWLPFLWLSRGRWRRWGPCILAFLLVAVPWYALCYARNGAAFPEEFFLRHQLGRFTSDALQHRQPVWFYVPVLAGLLFPWSPLLIALRWPRPTERQHLLAITVAWGLVFFSASTNKLPGYLLPLLPALCALLGKQLAARPRPWLIAMCGALLGLVPLVAVMLPSALQDGLTHAWAEQPLSGLMALALPVGACLWWLERRAYRTLAVCTMVLLVTGAVMWLKVQTYPVLDRHVSARQLAREVALVAGPVCSEPLHRDWEYGLAFYGGAPLPPCRDSSAAWHIIRQNAGRPLLVKAP